MTSGMRLGWSAVVVAVLAARCSTGPEPEEIAFTLGGKRYVTSPGGSSSARGFSLYAEDWSSFGRLEMRADGCSSCERAFAPFDSTAWATLRDPQGIEFNTQSYGGRGQVKVSITNCRVVTAIDPETGDRVQVTFCDASGSFAFTARSEAGDSVVVRDGHFHWTVQRW